MQFTRPRRQERREDRGRLPPVWLAALTLCFSVPFFSATTSAPALSEIQREDLPPSPSASPSVSDEDTAPPNATIPVPGPIQAAPPAAAEPADEDEPGDAARPGIEDDGPPPEIVYNLDRLPEPVRRMHDLLLAAAKSGDLEKLRPLIGTGDNATQLTFGGLEGDPIAFIKSLSGDPEGQEILAIMEEVLNAGFVHLDAGTPNELYVWPYFFAIPLDKLTPPQRVELFKIVTAGDYEDMKTFGSYIFYRLGIGPDGHWAFFVAGD